MKLKKLASILPFLLLFSVGCQTRAVPEPPPQIETETTELFSQAELDQMLAPIALYPDALLSQVLMASTYPLEIVEASRWSRDVNLDGEAAVDAAQTMDWDISIKALVAFPDLIQLMDEQLAWTRKLGDAFLLQEEQVMETIQMLRRKSLDEGNLESLDHLVIREEEEVIIVEPREVEVVYVPYYNTRYVYGDWWWYDYPPIYWDYPRYHYNHIGFYWGAGFRISSRFYFSFCDWHHHDIILHHHRWYHGRDRKPDRHDMRYDYDYNKRPDFDHPRRPGSPLIIASTPAEEEKKDIRTWNHNPYHRRGVEYKSETLSRTHERTSASGIANGNLPNRSTKSTRGPVRTPDSMNSSSGSITRTSPQKTIPSSSARNRTSGNAAKSMQASRSDDTESRQYSSPAPSSRNRTTATSGNSTITRSNRSAPPPTTASRSSSSTTRPPSVASQSSSSRSLSRTPSTTRSSSSRSTTRPPAASNPPPRQMSSSSRSSTRTVTGNNSSRSSTAPQSYSRSSSSRPSTGSSASRSSSSSSSSRSYSPSSSSRSSSSAPRSSSGSSMSRSSSSQSRSSTAYNQNSDK